jgi:hypothetical protein
MIITISISDWVVNSYLSGTVNRSKRAEKLIILGAEAEVKTTDQDKKLILNLIQERDNLKTEIKQLQLKNASLKSTKSRNLTELSNNKLYDNRICNVCKEAYDYELDKINGVPICKQCQSDTTK